MTSLIKLPNKLLLEIAALLVSLKDLVVLMATCRSAKYVADRLMMTNLRGYALHYVYLYWSVGKSHIAGVRRALNFGLDPNILLDAVGRQARDGAPET